MKNVVLNEITSLVLFNVVAYLHLYKFETKLNQNNT